MHMLPRMLPLLDPNPTTHSELSPISCPGLSPPLNHPESSPHTPGGVRVVDDVRGHILQGARDDPLPPTRPAASTLLRLHTPGGLRVVDDVGEHVLYGARDDPAQAALQVALHGVRLPGARLTIRDDGRVVSLPGRKRIWVCRTRGGSHMGWVDGGLG
eukprot:352061-Chlamydomonas_euryale.AAC.2